jgi:hypothetical protein
VLVVADIAHMPDGCGTWPAFWSNGYGPWPAGGEFDIIEGTNGGGKNRVTLHTQSNQCAIPKVQVPGMSEYSGVVRRHECTYGAGCSIEDQNPKSWAAPFNQNGGGWYVMRRNRGGYKVWFFERNGNVPASIRNGESRVDEEQLGKPVADFPFWNGVAGENCKFQEQFTDHQLIFNIAMGGHWAEGNFKNFGCEGEIYDLILNHPEKLSEAYWLINSLRIYGPDGDAAATPDAGAAALNAEPTQPAAAAPPPTETKAVENTPAPEPTAKPEQPAKEPEPAPQPEQPAEEPESEPAVEEPAPEEPAAEEPAPPAAEEGGSEEGQGNSGNGGDNSSEGSGGRGGRGRGRWRGSWRGSWRASAYHPGDE